MPKSWKKRKTKLLGAVLLFIFILIILLGGLIMLNNKNKDNISVKNEIKKSPKRLLS